MKPLYIIGASLLIVAIVAYSVVYFKNSNAAISTSTEDFGVAYTSNIPEPTAEDINKTDAEWKSILTPAAYAVLREKGTERPFTSPLNEENRAGTYVTADCGEPVFRSEQKFESGTGWPSFWAPIEGSVELREDAGLLGVRTEVVSKKCGSHLGHVFTDGPEPTGQRWCMNGVALRFIPDEV